MFLKLKFMHGRGKAGGVKLVEGGKELEKRQKRCLEKTVTIKQAPKAKKSKDSILKKWISQKNFTFLSS